MLTRLRLFLIFILLILGHIELFAQCFGSSSYDEWAFVIGGVDDESIVDAALDDCGNFYVIGFTEGSTSINFDPNGSNNVSFAGGTAKRCFIVKYDATGQLAWAKNLPYQPSSIDVTPNGKIGLIGNFQGTKDFDLGSGINQLTANSGDEIFIATYDADAQLIWVKQLDGDGTDNAGDIAFGPNEEIGFTLGINEFTGSDSIDFNPDTALVDAYGFYSCGGCGNNPMKKFLVVFDSTGQWRHTQGATLGCGGVSSPGKCAIDESGNVFFANVGCGEYWTQGDVHSIYKFNAIGNKIWSKHLTGPGTGNGDETLGLQVDENGDVYLLGKFMHTVLVDSTAQISLNNDFHVGAARCYRDVCGYRAFVAKYSSDGEYDWAHKVGYSHKNLYPVQHSLATDFSVRGGNVTISGQMLRELDFDPELLDTAVILNYDTTQWNLDSLYMEAYVASYTYEGDYKSHFLLGGPEDEGGLQIGLDDLGNVYIAGEFNDQVDLDVDSATLDLESSIGGYDLAFLKVFVDTAVFPENLDSNYVQGPDTCWNTGQKIVNNDREAGDFFGSTVAMDGEWAFTGTTDDLNGSNQNAGAVYAFRKDTNWIQTQKIVPNYRSEGEYFGHLMAVDDDVLMICNDPGSGDTIKVYYFKRNTSNVWEQQQVITAGLTNKTPTSIDIENGYAYVGVSSQGKVLVYELSGSTWSLDQTITGASGNRFGVSVSVENDLLAVGAFWDDFDENGQNNINKAGSVKLYTRSGQNPWSLSTKVVSPNREANGYFGWDVELMNGELYVGSYTTDYQSLNQAGAVYRLADNSGWSTVQTILPAEHFSGGIFGYAIDSDDDKLIVGHRRYSGVVSGNTLTWEGAAHLFALNDSNDMEEIEVFLSTNRNAGDEFGLDVAISGTSTIVGSYFDQTDENNSNTISQAGAAHIFDGDCDSILVVYVYDTTNVELCSGDSTYAQGAWQFNAGQFIDTISIDTILLTNVSIANAINTSDTLTICNGGSVMVHGQMVSQPGTYVDSNQTNAGCDSISTILVQEGTGSYQFELAWIYDGDSTFLGGAYQTTPDLYVDTMASQSGCDSIVETLLWVYPVQYGTDSITICQGESILLGGVMRSSAGTYTDTAMIGGTAHINQVSLFINQPVVSNSTMSITTGDSIYLAGAWRYSSGTYCDTIGGCDTVSCVQLTVGNLTSAM